MEPGLINQAVKQMFFLVGATTLNNIMLRKDMCSCRKGMQIRSAVGFMRMDTVTYADKDELMAVVFFFLGVTSVTWRNG